MTSIKRDAGKLAGLIHTPRECFAIAAAERRAAFSQPEGLHMLATEAFLGLAWDDCIAPQLMAHLVTGAAPALDFGARKYSPGNYAITGFPVTRTLDAAARHLLCLSGPADAPLLSERDPESGLPHVFHACAMLLFAAECSRFTSLHDLNIPKERLLCT
jgi:hypothetical protein